MMNLLDVDAEGLAGFYLHFCAWCHGLWLWGLVVWVRLMQKELFLSTSPSRNQSRDHFSAGTFFYRSRHFIWLESIDAVPFYGASEYSQPGLSLQ